MEVVTIEKRTFSYVCERFTEFAKRIESLCSTHTQKVENWLIVRKCASCWALVNEHCNIIGVAGDWLILKSATRFIINLLILKESLQIAKHRINHPNKPRLMKRTKEDYPSFNLFSIVGTWESVNLNPTVIIYRNDKEYLLSIIYVSETTKQASPATYEIQQDGSHFIAFVFKRLYIDYDPVKDALSISSLGDYLRN